MTNHQHSWNLLSIEKIMDEEPVAVARLDGAQFCNHRVAGQSMIEIDQKLKFSHFLSDQQSLVISFSCMNHSLD